MTDNTTLLFGMLRQHGVREDYLSRVSLVA